MQQVQIIAYRNPLEAAIWEGIMNPGNAPLFLGILCAFVVFVPVMMSADKLGRKFVRGWTYGKNAGMYGRITMALSAVLAGIALWWVAFT